MVTQFDPQAYGPTLARLLTIDRRRPLGPGTADTTARSALDALSVESAFAGAQVADRDMAACVISATWLVHDYLDESHTISQGVASASGSFWHGIMRRREGDYGNAKYWFRRVGYHPVLDRVAARAAELVEHRAADDDARAVVTKANWDPFAFVDLCEAALRGRDQVHELCRDVQQAEWELLFDFCYQAA